MEKTSKLTNFLLLSMLCLTLSYSACKKDDEFNTELVAEEYTGSLDYFTSIDGGEVGNYMPDLSKSGDYKTTITKIGSNYILSFDKSFIYALPDISIDIKRFMNTETAVIGTLVGQAYSSSTVGNNPSEPSNYFSILKYPQLARCNITLKSNDPDSIYYLSFRLTRNY